MSQVGFNRFNALPAFKGGTQPQASRFGAEEKAKPLTPLSQMSQDEQKDVTAFGERYKDFLGQAVCAPLTARMIIQEAQKRGFRPFPGRFTGVAMPGDKFYINNGYNSVALVVIGKNNPTKTGFNIVGAHMDSPQLRLKRPNAISEEAGVARLRTETHGGGIWMEWFNRPLGIAGTIHETVPGQDGKPAIDPKTRRPLQKTRFVKFDSPSVAIASEPIHFNRDINNGRKINPEEDMTPIAAIENGAEGAGVADHAKSLLAEKGINLNQANSSNLWLYSSTPPQDTGVDKSMVIGGGQDDRSMCFAAMDALFEAAENGPPQNTSMALFFDDEEVGSLSPGGARSAWLEKIAGQLINSQTLHPHDWLSVKEALANSVIFSADVAHGFLPQQAKYHDKLNHAKMGFGPAIKTNANGNYATTPEGANLAQAIAERAGVPLQFMSMNQDVSCGTTIGPMIGANTGALTIDIGTPLLSMHSPGEIVSKADLYNTKRLFSAFYQGK